MNKPHNVKCYICLNTCNFEEVIAAKIIGCPNCGTQVPPMKLNEFGYIHVNWQDIRVLAIYAQRWAETFPKDIKGNIDHVQALKNIVGNLQRFRPPTGDPLDAEIQAPPVAEAIEQRKVIGIKSPYFYKKK